MDKKSSIDHARVINNRGNFIENTDLDDVTLKIIPNFHLLSQKKSKLWYKMRKVAPSVLLHKSHKRKYIS